MKNILKLKITPVLLKIWMNLDLSLNKANLDKKKKVNYLN